MAAEPSQSGLARTETGLRLGGARADFVASLGRKVADLRVALERASGAEGHPTSDVIAAVDELQRKLHALASGAKLMKFDAMERAIAEATTTLSRVGDGERPGQAELEAVGHVLADLPALAWGDERAHAPRSKPVERAQAPTYSAMIIGPALLAEALLDEVETGPSFACECTPDAQAAFDLACVTEPDLLVLDADLEDATELVDAFMDDARTEATPIVVVGSFLEPGEEARYVAMGVAKTLAKPTSRETLRALCIDALEPPRPVVSSVIVGEPTLSELGERLAEEFRRALVGDADPRTRGQRIALGEGTEVLSAVWGAIARVREIVSARSGGAVRFAGAGPEGAIAVSTSFGEHDVARADRARAHARGLSSEVRLQGRRVVVADDDPAVVWFLADLLKAAGCIVHEAFDGGQAIELAYRTSPDLVITDLLMPEVDGFTVCRTLRRDVALRDVPVIVLSWKEDLLQRVRELGVSAAGYVRKESDAKAIVARVREALRPRTRVEARLREDGRVRGRLDDMSVRTLLELVCAMRPDARIAVRDASFLYELEVRNGAPVRAMCVASGGATSRGKEVLATMLGVRAGSFVVTPSTALVDVDLDGNLAAQLAHPIATARAATALLLDVRPTETTLRVTVDEQRLVDYLRATPEGFRGLARQLADGTPHRALVLQGADPMLVAELACELASRGVIRAIESEAGEDLLETARAKLLEQGDKRASFAPRTLTPAPEAAESIARAKSAEAFEELTDDLDATSCSVDPAPLCESPIPAVADSLQDALNREVILRSPEPAEVERSVRSSVVDPAELRPRPSHVPPPVVESPSLDALDTLDRLDEALGWTPLHDDLTVVAEPTIIDDTVYGERSEPVATTDAPNADPTGAHHEAPSADAPAGDVSSDLAAAGLASRRESWPIIAFVTVVFAIAWAVMRFAHIAL